MPAAARRRRRERFFLAPKSDLVLARAADDTRPDSEYASAWGRAQCLMFFSDLLLALAVVSLGLAQVAADDHLTSTRGPALGAFRVILFRSQPRSPYAVATRSFRDARARRHRQPMTRDAGDGEASGFICLFVSRCLHRGRASRVVCAVWIGGADSPRHRVGRDDHRRGRRYLGAMLFFGLLIGTPWVVGRATRRQTTGARPVVSSVEQSAGVAEAADRARAARRRRPRDQRHGRAGARRPALLDEDPRRRASALDAIEAPAAGARRDAPAARPAARADERRPARAPADPRAPRRPRRAACARRPARRGDPSRASRSRCRPASTSPRTGSCRRR